MTSSKTSSYRKQRARAYMAKFDIRYVHALRLVNEEMARPEFKPIDPLPEKLPSNDHHKPENMRGRYLLSATPLADFLGDDDGSESST